jgi:multicomponent Na+:H+ antiporter subunit C
MSIEAFFEQAQQLFNYWVVVFLMMTGFYIVIARGNLIRTIIGLNIFQTSVFLLYISMGKVDGATAPIIPPYLADKHEVAVLHQQPSIENEISEQGKQPAEEVYDQLSQERPDVVYSNPLPSVLMLTAIVVGIATTATALSLIVRIREDYGTIEEDEILEMDRNA